MFEHFGCRKNVPCCKIQYETCFLKRCELLFFKDSMEIPKRTTSSLGRSVMHWLSCALGTRTESWFGHRCTGNRILRMLWENERNSPLGMDALVIVCSCNTNRILVWAWMLSSSHSLEHERNYGFGMDAKVIVCSWTPTELWYGHGCSPTRTQENMDGIMG